ncbi:MAG: hypothetical protein JSS72_02570 [Armatimonadetes bacterium]|nr:hypothetical protein [Armatimonadota bacterium]
MRKAVIDVGSNSVLLLIEELDSGNWKTVREATAVTSLGEGVKQTGKLGEPGIANTLAALQDFFKIANDCGCSQIRAAATMAARMATNTSEFLERATAQGTPCEVLPGEEEAQLGFEAAALDPSFGMHPRLSIIDVGGQSTELVTAERKPDGWEMLFRRSFPIGTLALLSGTLSDETPQAPAILRAVAEIDDIIGMDYLPHQAGYPIVLGATGTNLVSIREHLMQWEPLKVHGAWLDYEEISKASHWLFGLSFELRSEVVGMEPGRERTLPIGALILERFLQKIHVLGCAVSVRGWRHAMLEKADDPIPAK